MRELTSAELEMVSGGGSAPLGSPTAGQYFETCLGYAGPSNSVNFGIGLAGLLSGPVGRAFALGGAATLILSGTVCGLGTIQYAQYQYAQ